MTDFTPAEEWFASRDWTPFDFQREVWSAYLLGESGLLHAATGTGKTMAAWWGPLLEWLASHERRERPQRLQVLWVTPMRALAADTERALAEVVADLGIAWTVERRTGDTASSAKARQFKKAPAALVTTPESLALMLSQEGAREYFSSLVLLVADEWHELLGSKRGSLAAETRAWVEDGLRDGRLRAVIATASLDLGVDFSPVDRVLQIGSPKGIARLLQRAGRSGHQPGALSRVSCVPTNALELVEAAAARDAAEGGRVEPRLPLAKPLDVLVQHLVTVGLGGGFVPADLLAEVRTAYGYRNLSDAEWQWSLDFVVNGGGALGAYPEYRRLAEVDGSYRVVDKDIAQRHRLSIGTITSDPVVEVKYVRGPSLGSTSESFISRLKPGDRFIFSGTPLEFVRVHDMTAWVRRASSNKGAIPTWTGTGLPISQELSDAVLAKLGEARAGRLDGPEMQAVEPVLRVQMKVSTLLAPGELLIERVKTREGHHLFFYPFAGKLVNAGLAALFAYRLSRLQPITFSTIANDYGFELLASMPVTKLGISDDLTAFRRHDGPQPVRSGEHGPLLAAEDVRFLFDTDTLLNDILASMNAGEMGATGCTC